MSAGSRKDDVVGAVSVILLLIGTATGSAMLMLGMSATALILLPLIYRRRIGTGGILAAFVAAVTAALTGVVFSVR